MSPEFLWTAFSMLVKLSKDYDEIFHYLIDFNAHVRDMPYNEGTGKVYMGMGIYLLPEKPAD